MAKGTQPTPNRFWTDPDGRTWRIRLEHAAALKGSRAKAGAYVLCWVHSTADKFNVPLPGPIDLEALTDEQLEEIQAGRRWGRVGSAAGMEGAAWGYGGGRHEACRRCGVGGRGLPRSGDRPIVTAL